jgi:hypothetical protein
MGMNISVVTHCFKQVHYEALMSVFPIWMERLSSDCQFVVGFMSDRAPDAFKNWVESVSGRIENIVFHPFENSLSYGQAYNTLVENRNFDVLLVLAPFVVPKHWLIGSITEWIKNYSLIGHYKPPRVLIAEQLLLPLVAPVIIELGRMNLDCVVAKPDFLIDFSYTEHLFGTVLVRGRPGANLLFNALIAGRPILTLPYACKPIRYVVKEHDFRSSSLKEAIGNADL